MNHTEAPSLRARTIALLYACFAGLWIVLSDYGMEALISSPLLLQELEVYKGLAFVAVTSVLLYFLLKVPPPGKASIPEAIPGPNAQTAPANMRSEYRIFVVVLALVLTVPALGYGILSVYTPLQKQEAYSDLLAIATLKAEQVELWRTNMVTIVAGIPEMERVAQELEQIAAGEAGALSADSLDALRSPLEAYALAAIMVLDASGNEIGRLGEAGGLPPETLRLLPEVNRTGATVNGELVITDTLPARMDIVRPLRADGPNSARSGYLVARFDPDDFLFPLIQRWPGGSGSGESNLVRLDGDQVLYLHLSNPRGGTAGFRLPMTSPDLPAAIALRERGNGTAAGVDYAGVPVFGAYAEAGTTGWMIVAKLSQEEALAPVSELASWISLIMFLTITAIAVVLIMMWRQQQRAWELSLRVSTAERDGLLRQFYDLPFLGMAFNNPGDASWMQFNDTLCQILGYSREELHKMDWLKVTHPEDRPAEQEAMARILRGEVDGYRMDKRLLRKNGEISHATIDVKAVRNAEGGVKLLVSMLQDITERKRAELDVQKLTRYYVALSQMNEMIVRERDSQRVMDEACKIAETSGKLALVWIGILDEDNRNIVPLASSGASPAYLNELHISLNPDLDIGRGPTTLAFREGRTAVFNQFQTDPASAPWHALAGRWGLRSTAVCPVRRRGKPWGVMAFYSSEADYFSPDLVSLLEKLSIDIGYGLDALQTQHEIAQAQAQLLLNAKMLESSHEGIFITDAQNRFTMVNKAFCEITGYSEDELLGAEPRMLKSGRQDPAFYAALWQTLDSTGVWQGEIWDRRKDGGVFPAWLSITRVQNQQVAIFTDITARKEYENRIEHIAHHDVLTDLPNRMLLADRIAMAIARAHREKQRIAVVFIDLDRFKLVNDTLGHDIGDLLLQEVARRIVGALRASDTVSRVGGDEFIALLPDVVDAEDAARAATKIIDAVAMPYALAGHEVIITTSAGIALYPENGLDGAELSRLADVAMMEAKQTGRNRYHFFSAELGLSAGRRLELEHALRGAVERGEISLDYQPQFCLRSGHLAGFEALARWTHPVLGSIPPADFIPVAETSGLILPIGKWILREACRQMSVWRQQADLQFPISVNVSALQFRQADYLLQVQEALQTTGLPAASLELELTESLLMSNVETVLDKLRRLDELGVGLAIDDFGTGYSSLSYLRQFPAHRLKIDQSFVRDLPASADAAAIARAIVSLGGTLGMQTIAEGVETAEQAAFLQDIQCDLGQGYLLSYPLSAAAMEALIEEKRAEGALLACPERVG
jgi:diguanylate cyclase (GGDEF)-like protein/PAS domain S-box-containing protein